MINRFQGGSPGSAWTDELCLKRSLNKDCLRAHIHTLQIETEIPIVALEIGFDRPIIDAFLYFTVAPPDFLLEFNQTTGDLLYTTFTSNEGGVIAPTNGFEPVLAVNFGETGN